MRTAGTNGWIQLSAVPWSVVSDEAFGIDPSNQVPGNKRYVLLGQRNVHLVAHVFAQILIPKHFGQTETSHTLNHEQQAHT